MSMPLPITYGMKLAGYSPGRFYWHVDHGAIKVNEPENQRTITAIEVERLLREPSSLQLHSAITSAASANSALSQPRRNRPRA